MGGTRRSLEENFGRTPAAGISDDGTTLLRLRLLLEEEDERRRLVNRTPFGPSIW